MFFFHEEFSILNSFYDYTIFFLIYSYEKLVTGVKKFDTEGLNSLKYEVRGFERKVLYTWILAEVKQDSVCISKMRTFPR